MRCASADGGSVIIAGQGHAANGWLEPEVPVVMAGITER